MKTYQILKVVEDITTRDYAVKAWMADDLCKELMPLFRVEFQEEYAGEVWDEAAQEGYGEGFEEGKEAAYSEARQEINELVKTGEYDLETLMAVKSLLW